MKHKKHIETLRAADAALLDASRLALVEHTWDDDGGAVVHPDAHPDVHQTESPDLMRKKDKVKVKNDDDDPGSGSGNGTGSDADYSDGLTDDDEDNDGVDVDDVADKNDKKKGKKGKGNEKRADKQTVKDALDALAQVPDAGPRDMIHVPFPYVDDAPFRLRRKSLLGAYHRKLKAEKLFALQPLVKRARVKRFIRKQGIFSDIPVIVRVKKRYFIYDGHHRLTADRFLGKDKVRVNCIDIGDGE